MATKDDFTKRLAEVSGESKALCDKIIAAVPDAMTKELDASGEVRIPHVGVFRAKYVPERMYKNFLEGGKEVKAKARMRVTVKAASALSLGLKLKTAKAAPAPVAPKTAPKAAIKKK